MYTYDICLEVQLAHRTIQKSANENNIAQGKVSFV